MIGVNCGETALSLAVHAIIAVAITNVVTKVTPMTG